MKKSVVMVITLICMLGLLNCNRVGFTKAHLGHWKVDTKGGDLSSIFISENQIYSLNGEKIVDMVSYTIKSENKKENKKVITDENEEEVDFIFSDHYKTLTLSVEDYDDTTVLTFIDNTQKPSEDLIKEYDSQKKISENRSNLKNIAVVLDMYAADNKDVYPNDNTPAAKDHIFIKDGYLARPVVDPITGKDYTVKLIDKDHYIISCPNPEKYGYKNIDYYSEGGLKEIK